MNSKTNKESKNTELFFPYYINQGRLLDLYAILNGGYSEYYEVVSAISDKKSKSGKAEVSGGVGFKIFNFGSSAEGSISNDATNSDERRERKVQTVTSVLSIVMTRLENKQHIKPILESKPGDFVCLSVNLSINSIKHLMDEIIELLELINSLQKAGVKIDVSRKDVNDWKVISKTMQSLFAGEEILYESDNYAIIGNITDGNLYQAVREDLIGTEMQCLAQVKRIFPEGTELMKNTIFTKLRDKVAKDNLIESMKEFTEGDDFGFESIAVSSIEGKPVYQLEIIALYQ